MVQVPAEVLIGLGSAGIAYLYGQKRALEPSNIVDMREISNYDKEVFSEQARAELLDQAETSSK